MVPQYRPESFGSTAELGIVDSDLSALHTGDGSGLLNYCVYHGGGATIPGKKLSFSGNLAAHCG